MALLSDVFSWNHFAYLGWYGFPVWRPRGQKFGYGTHAAAFSAKRDSLFVAGYGLRKEIAELSLPADKPATIGEAPRLLIRQDLIDPTPDLEVERAELVLDRLGGIAVIGDELALTYHRYYAVQNAHEIDSPTLVMRSQDLSDPESGKLAHVGPSGVWPFHQKHTSNYAMAIPPAARKRLAEISAHFGAEADYALAVGKGDGPGSGGVSHGPALFATELRPRDNTGNDTRAKILLDYSKTHPIENWKPSDFWEGGVWIEYEGRTAVMFAGTRGDLGFWYGGPEYRRADGDVWKDRCRGGSKGYHSPSYSAELRIYDPRGLFDIAEGEREPWDLAPAEIRLIELPDARCNDIGSIAFDPNRGRLYIIERRGETPRLHVWQVDAPAVEPEPDPPTEEPEEPGKLEIRVRLDGKVIHEKIIAGIKKE